MLSGFEGEKSSFMNISLVSYINTRPFADGLEAHYPQADLLFYPPSQCTQSLLRRESSMALVPVGSLLDFDKIQLLPDYCIGAVGAVGSVFIFAQCPLEEAETLLLDSHSRSSNGLAQVLLHYYWKKKLNILPATAKHFDQIQGKTAGVVIGDKALKIKDQYPYVYDLAEVWYKMTGMGFAFAVWAYYAEAFTEPQLADISEALRLGVENRLQTAQKWAENFNFSVQAASDYLNHQISYDFDKDKKESMELYLKMLQKVRA